MPKIVVSTVPKKDLMIVVPYLRKLSLKNGTRINRVIKNQLPYCNFPVVFQTKFNLINVFAFKDRILVFLRSCIIYNLSVAVTVLPIMAKLSAMLKLESVSTLQFLLILERK